MNSQDNIFYIHLGMKFAFDFLNIQNIDFFRKWSVLDYSKYRGWSGRYIPETKSIEFNGFPSYLTIFHEAVHYKQHEKGINLRKSYSKNETFEDYYWHPLEVSARYKANKMERKIKKEYPNLVYPTINLR